MKTLFLTVVNAGIYIGIFEANLKQAYIKYHRLAFMVEAYPFGRTVVEFTR
jgi:hypothetical protein